MPTIVKVGGNALTLKRAQLIPCTVVLYDKGGTIQWAGCLRPGVSASVSSNANDHMISSTEVYWFFILKSCLTFLKGLIG